MLKMVIDSFLIDDNNIKSRFFEEKFLLANINIDIIFKMLFFNLNNLKIDFNDWKDKWRLYIIVEVLPIIRQIELIRKKFFITLVLDLNNKTFVVYIIFLIYSDPVYPFYRAQIVLLRDDNTLSAILC